MNKIGFFQEEPGHDSFIRLESFMVLIIVLIFLSLFNTVYAYAWLKDVLHDKPIPAFDQTLFWFDAGAMCLAFFPKLFQKMIEMKFGIKPNGDSTTIETAQKITTTS